jgi:hypothetical protein
LYDENTKNVRQISKEYFKLNKNILTAFAASITISAIVAQLLANQENYLNSTYTLIVDYIVYFSVFGTLYYRDNQRKYKLSSGQTDTESLRKDLLKIITSLGIAEIVYTIIRWILQYYFLTIGYDPYIASISGQGIATVVYMIVVNLSVKMTRLYKSDG